MDRRQEKRGEMVLVKETKKGEKFSGGEKRGGNGEGTAGGLGQEGRYTVYI